jgi:hypothetical protein
MSKALRAAIAPPSLSVRYRGTDELKPHVQIFCEQCNRSKEADM